MLRLRSRVFLRGAYRDPSTGRSARYVELVAERNQLAARVAWAREVLARAEALEQEMIALRRGMKSNAKRVRTRRGLIRRLFRAHTRLLLLSIVFVIGSVVACLWARSGVRGAPTDVDGEVTTL